MIRASHDYGHHAVAAVPPDALALPYIWLKSSTTSSKETALSFLHCLLAHLLSLLLPLMMKLA